MTDTIIPRSRWVARAGTDELTYIGREIEGKYHVEVLVVRAGDSKVVYAFRVPDMVAGDTIALAGRVPDERINCEFTLSKDNASDNVAYLTSPVGNTEKVDLSTNWYAEL